MKQVLLPLIMLIIGLCIGYLICKNGSKNMLSTDGYELNEQKTSFSGAPDTVFRMRAEAQGLIDKFRTMNTQTLPSALRLYAENGQPLRGFYIPRKDLDEILSNTDASGISIYIAKHRKHDNTTDRIFTLIFRGAKLKGSKFNNNPDDIEGFGEYYDYIKPCPTVCGE